MVDRIPPERKISPAFDAYLADRGRADKREAIVIYRAPDGAMLDNRSQLREQQKRRRQVEERVTAQKAVEERLAQSYETIVNRQKAAPANLALASIGSSALPVATVEVTPQTLSALAEHPEVVAILPNQPLRLIQPKEIDYVKLRQQEAKQGHTWGLELLGIPKLWETTQGAAINVAVLDTGVYGDHPALAGRVTDFVLIDPLGRRIRAQPSFDGGEHGTHVCGTIAGGRTPDEKIAIGVAPAAQLLVAGVLVGDATLRTLLEGIDWAIEQGADIINMSLGFNYYEPLFTQVFAILVEQYGILPVVAIGNENHGNSSSPGNAYNAFSVGAVEKLSGRTKQVEVAFFSSGASLVFPGGDQHSLVTKPDLVAPGTQVYSAIPPARRADGTYTYSYMNGTSMATPHVSGVAALLMAARPNAPVTEIMQALKETAKHPGGTQKRPDNRWGYGLIQPTAALQALA